LPETQPEPPPGAGHGFGATAEPLRHCSRLRPGGAARATGTGRMAARSPKIARTTIARRGCGLLNRVTDSTSECVRPERSARRRCAQRSDGQARSIRTWRSGDAADNVGQPRSAGGRRGSPRRDPSPANPPVVAAPDLQPPPVSAPAICGSRYSAPGRPCPARSPSGPATKVRDGIPVVSTPTGWWRPSPRSRARRSHSPVACASLRELGVRRESPVARPQPRSSGRRPPVSIASCRVVPWRSRSAPAVGRRGDGF
jgi:hypothetical protein